MSANDLIFTILTDNYAGKAHLAEWGFAVHISWKNKNYLFDTGLRGDTLMKNAEELGVSLDSLDGIIISHGHYDHVGGLEILLSQTSCRKLYAHPDIFDPKYTEKERRKDFAGLALSRSELQEKFGLNMILAEKIFEIDSGMYLTGEVPVVNSELSSMSPEFFIKKDNNFVKDPFRDDNSLVFDFGDKVILLLGCAHRGVVNILQFVSEHFKKPVGAIMGGMHLFDMDQKRITKVLDYIDDKKIPLIIPCHCTGLEPSFKMKNRWGDGVQIGFCGKRIVF